jgi:hypothetical protein
MFNSTAVALFQRFHFFNCIDFNGKEAKLIQLLTEIQKTVSHPVNSENFST